MYLATFLLLIGTTLITCTTTEDSSLQQEEQTPQPHQSCRYWCIYNGTYCCDDGSLPMPAEHLEHTHLECPPMEEQRCKDNGIFLDNTYPFLVLAKGEPKMYVKCASDGYCKEEERCCPSPCSKRHVCLIGLKKEITKGKVQGLEGEGMEDEVLE